MKARRLTSVVVAGLLTLSWLIVLVIGPLYLGLTGEVVYRWTAHDRRLTPRLSAILAVELAPRLPQSDTYRWIPRQPENLQPVLETVLKPAALAPFLARIGPAWFRWSLGQGPAPEPLNAAVRTYLIEPQRALILDALWQALPPCAPAGAFYCRPDSLPPAEQGYAYAALRSAWDEIEMDLYAHLETWQQRAVVTPPLSLAPAWIVLWPFLALVLSLALVALAPTRELPWWLALPLVVASLGALGVAWYLPAWAGYWVARWGLEGASVTVQSYALTLAQVLLEAAAWGIVGAAGLALALAGLVLMGSAGARWRLWGGVGAALFALVTVALLVWLAQPPPVASPQPTPTLWPSPTITLTPTATPYWPVQPGTPVPTPVGGLSLIQPPQKVGCLQALPEPILALDLELNTLTLVQPTGTTLIAPQTLSPTAVLTQPMVAERALLWADQALLVRGTQARLYLLPTFTEVYTSHIPILSPIRAVEVMPARLQVLLGLEEGRIWIVDATNGDADWSLWNIERHSAALTALASHPSRPWVASGAANGEVWLWDVEAGQRLRVFSGHTAAITALAFSPDGAELLSADAAGQLILWDVASAEIRQRWPLPDGDSVKVLKWQEALALGGTRQGRLMLVGGESLWLSQPQDAAITALDLHANRIAVGLENGQACLWTQARP